MSEVDIKIIKGKKNTKLGKRKAGTGLKKIIKLGKTKYANKGKPSMSKFSMKKLKSVIERPIHNSSRNSDYLHTLLNPELQLPIKLPMRVAPSIFIKRRLLGTISANASGYASLVVNPNYLSDLTDLKSTAIINEDVNFKPSGAVNIGAPVYTVPSQAITAGTISNYRLISSALVIMPQNAATAQQGTIHGALMPLPQITLALAGAAETSLAPYTYLSAMTDCVNYNNGSVSALQGLRVRWQPIDTCAFEFSLINKTIFNDNGAKYDNYFVVTLDGVASGGKFRYEIFQNFEVTTVPGTLLQGMESTNKDMTDPLLALGQLKSRYGSSVVQVVTVAGIQSTSMLYSNVQHWQHTGNPQLAQDGGTSNFGEEPEALSLDISYPQSVEDKDMVALREWDEALNFKKTGLGKLYAPSSLANNTSADLIDEISNHIRQRKNITNKEAEMIKFVLAQRENTGFLKQELQYPPEWTPEQREMYTKHFTKQTVEDGKDQSDELWKLSRAMGGGVQYHLPWHNYMGPGTNVIGNIIAGVKPTNYNDYIAAKHDIAYLSDDKQNLSDDLAIKHSSFGINGIAMKVGLSSRKVVDRLASMIGGSFKFNGRTDTLQVDTAELQEYLYDRLEQISDYHI